MVIPGSTQRLELPSSSAVQLEIVMVLHEKRKIHFFSNENGEGVREPALALS